MVNGIYIKKKNNPVAVVEHLNLNLRAIACALNIRSIAGVQELDTIVSLPHRHVFRTWTTAIDLKLRIELFTVK